MREERDIYTTTALTHLMSGVPAVRIVDKEPEIRHVRLGFSCIRVRAGYTVNTKQERIILSVVYDFEFQIFCKQVKGHNYSSVHMN